MKTLLIILIQLYQLIISPVIKLVLGVSSQCRYTPTCSEYTKQSISKYGIVKGLQKATIRILSCQPFKSQNENLKMQNN